MLHDRDGKKVAATAAEPQGATGELPGVHQAFAVAERPAGVRFYLPKESFYRPYSLLQAMRYQADRLTLVFASDDVVIEGHGLHFLYVRLAEQAVSQIVEQGDRYADAAEAVVCVSRIRVIVRDSD
jgi:hypothetical protein